MGIIEELRKLDTMAFFDNTYDSLVVRVLYLTVKNKGEILNYVQ